MIFIESNGAFLVNFVLHALKNNICKYFFLQLTPMISYYDTSDTSKLYHFIKIVI